jgi:hypothetical protein
MPRLVLICSITGDVQSGDEHATSKPQGILLVPRGKCCKVIQAVV